MILGIQLTLIIKSCQKIIFLNQVRIQYDLGEMIIRKKKYTYTIVKGVGLRTKVLTKKKFLVSCNLICPLYLTNYWS